MDIVKAGSDLSDLRRRMTHAEFLWRYRLGETAEKIDQLRREEGKTFYYKGKEITGAGKAMASICDISQSDVSRCRAFYRLFTWDEIRERVDRGFEWSSFKILIDNHKILGGKIKHIPMGTSYAAFRRWVDTLIRTSVSE